MIADNKYFEKDGKYYNSYYYEANSNRISSCDGYKTVEISFHEYLYEIQSQRLYKAYEEIDDLKDKIKELESKLQSSKPKRKILTLKKG